jgi:tetratricopeptide (TPR) repeat protein
MEEHWSLVTQYRVLLARDARRWEEAEGLQRLDVEWNRRRAAPILEKPPKAWGTGEKETICSLGASLHGLSQIQLERGSAGCVDGYREALSLAESLQDSPHAAVCAFNLGHAYEELDEIRDFDLAEQWYRRSLELIPKEDRMGRAGCLVQLGTVAYRRFLDARKSDRPPDECLGHLATAEGYYLKALKITPSNAAGDLATAHNQLGSVYVDAGQFDAALTHYRESIRYKEAMQDRYAAGQTRRNAALALYLAGRLADAREWALSALRDFEASENADQDVVKTLKLLELIQSESDPQAT